MTKSNRIVLNILGIKFSFVAPWQKSNNNIFIKQDDRQKKIKFIKGLKVKFFGANASVEFRGSIPKMKNVTVLLGNNSNVIISESAYRIKNLFINMRADNTTLIIGKDFSCESAQIDFHGEPDTAVTIGEDCQFGCNIEIDTADGHSIYDIETKELLNKPKNITIGSHVWLCKDVSILKGAVIPDNCVIAKRSLVTSELKTSNCIYAGIPAKPVQSSKCQNINWTRTANKNYIADK